MKRILVRSAQDPQKSYDALESTKKMGGNAGNLLYVNGVSRTLDSKNNKLSFGGFKTHTLPDVTDWVNQANKKYDHYVMPMANSFREGMTQSLRGMTEIVRRLDMPVTIVGIGAQATAKSFTSNDFQMASTGGKKKLDDHKTEEHNQVVRDFCNAVLEKSKSIGVRGEFTKEYLVALGIDPLKVRVIGCPSLYTWGPDHKIVNSVGNDFDGSIEQFDPELPLSLNIDYRLAGIERMIYANLFKYPNITSPSQDSKSARMIITKNEHYALEGVNLGTPIHTKHPMFLRNNVIYYPNPWGWVHDLSKKHFVFGTRLHGNIAGILGGTPAHLLAHDARTMELAKFHGIPYTIYDKEHDFLAEDLFKTTSYENFNNLMPKNFKNFIEFLNENDLSTIYDENGKTKNFDKEIEKLKMISAVFPN